MDKTGGGGGEGGRGARKAAPSRHAAAPPVPAAASAGKHLGTGRGGGKKGGGGGNRVPMGPEGSALLDRQSTDHAGTAPSKGHWPHQPPPAFDLRTKDFKLCHCRGNSLGALNKVGLFPSFLIRLKKKKP